jgi:hypothetical protein
MIPSSPPDSYGISSPLRISKTMFFLDQSGKLIRNATWEASGMAPPEEEESEQRTKGISLADKRRKIIGLTFQMVFA